VDVGPVLGPRLSLASSLGRRESSLPLERPARQ
jgi:hypothetical protein